MLAWPLDSMTATKFLRLIPHYRALEVELEQSGAARVQAESETREWKARCEMAEQQRDKAQAEHERSLKQTCNYQALLSGSPLVPFPDVYMPPAACEEPASGVNTRPARRQAREIQIEHNRIARAQALDQYNRMKHPAKAEEEPAAS